MRDLPGRRLLTSLLRWFDSDAGSAELQAVPVKKVDWLRIVPLMVLHAGCLGAFVVGWSPAALGTALALYLVRMFAITGFYHRYFSHKSFQTSRGWQLAFALAGAGCGSSNDGESQAVTVEFSAQVGGEDFVCGTTYDGLGADDSSLELTDFRFKINDL